VKETSCRDIQNNTLEAHQKHNKAEGNEKPFGVDYEA